MVRQSNDVFENAIKSANGLSEGTKKSYLKQLREAAHLLQPNYIDILEDPDRANRTLKSLVESKSISQNTARAIVAALISLFKHTPKSDLWMRGDNEGLRGEWSRVLEENNQKVTDWTEQNRLSTREEANWVDHKSWLSMEKELRDRERGSLRHLLVAFHSLMAPLRGGDLSNVEIVPSSNPLADEDADTNTSVLVWDGPTKPAKLLIREHKTRAYYPVLVREIPAEIKLSIAQSLKDQPRTMLFVNSHGGPWSRNSFLTWKAKNFQELFGKAVTTNLARHAYITSFKDKDESIADQRKRATEMGHSLKTQGEYRKIVDR